MKKAIISLIAILMLSLCVFTGCGDRDNKNKIPERPEDTNLEFWIAQDVSDVDFSEYEEVLGTTPGYHYLGKDYHSGDNQKRGCVSYVVHKYPDDSDSKDYISSILINDADVTVYGINCHSTFEEFDKVMKKNGYEVEVSNPQRNQTAHIASLGRVFITLSRTAYTDESSETSYLHMMTIVLEETDNN